LEDSDQPFLIKQNLALLISISKLKADESSGVSIAIVLG
jgi:hypothetical protein